MCLIITSFCALITFLIYKCNNSLYFRGGKSLCLSYTGAAMMWIVDCFISFFNGEGFFDLSLSDTILGLIVALSGLVLWFIYFRRLPVTF